MYMVTWVAKPVKRRSREEFEAYLKAMLDQDYPLVKYQSPNTWQARTNNKSRTS